MKKLLTAIVTVIVALGLAAAIPVSSETSSLWEAPKDSFVLDDAQVLYGSTEDEIDERNKAMYAMSGVQVAVLTVSDSGFSNLEEFAYHQFNYWGIGSAELNNGVLFVMETDTGKYWISPGYGVEKCLNSDVLTKMFESGIEDAIERKDYNSASLQFIHSIYNIFEKYYDVDYDSWDGITYKFGTSGSDGITGIKSQSGSLEYQQSGGGIENSIIAFLGTIALIIAVVIIFIMSVTARGFFYRRWRYGGYNRPGFFFFTPYRLHDRQAPRGPRGPGGGPTYFGGFGGHSSGGGFGGHSSGGGFGGHSSGGFGGFGGGGSRGGGFGKR